MRPFAAEFVDGAISTVCSAMRLKKGPCLKLPELERKLFGHPSDPEFVNSQSKCTGIQSPKVKVY
jgi:hypothetical protein